VELPRLQPLWEKYRDQGFSVIAVERRRDRKNALPFIEKHKLSFHFLETGEGADEIVAGKFGVGVFPTSFLIDQSGRIVQAHIGFEEGDEVKLEAEIVKLLK